MGRIKTKFVKRKTRELLEKYGENFGKDFKENKEGLKKVAEINSKKIRNVIAGYAVKINKNKSELDEYSIN